MRARLIYGCLLAVLAVSGLDPYPSPLRAQEMEGVRPDQMADLIATGLGASTLYPLPGEAVDVTGTLRNRAMHPEFKVTVALFAGSTRVASQVIDLAAGQSTTLHFPWRSTQVGAIRLTLRIDPDQTRLDVDRRDNEISVDVVVAPQPPFAVNFIISDVQFVAGSPSVIRATVRNGGTVAASIPVVVRADNTIATRQLITLGPGAEQVISIPWASSRFHGQLSVEANPRFGSNTSKGAAALSSRDMRPPDSLQVEDLSVSAAQFDPKRPRQITISFRIVNAGQDDIKQSFRTAIFPGSIKGGAAPLDTYYLSTSELAAASTRYVSRTFISPLGEFDVRVEADADHALRLANRTTTVATAKFKNPTPSPGRWVSIGPRVLHNPFAPPSSNGRVTAIAIDPNATSTVYIGAVGSGVWKTGDSGATWAPITDSLPSLDVAAIAVDPSSSSHIYVALAGGSGGVFHSTDGGVSWSQLSTDLGAEIRWGVLLVNPRNAALVYLATSGGIYVSSDSGAHWQFSKSGGEATDLVMDPANPSVLYAAFAGDGVYRTTNGGTSGNSDWTKLTAGLPTSGVQQITLALCRGTSSTVYAGYSLSSGFQLYRTTNSGSSWSLQSTPSFTGLFNDDIGVDSSDPNTVYITGVNLYRATDGGANFSALSGTHADNHIFMNDPVTAGVIYAGDDGGIYKSTDRGNTWNFFAEGVANTEFYDIADAPTAANIVIGGLQDNGVVKYDASSTVWNQIGGFGDGATVGIDASNAQTLYGMGQGIDSLALSTDGGNSFQNIAGGLPGASGGPAGCGDWNSNFQPHPTQSNTLLASPASGGSGPGGCGALYRTTNAQPPGNWSELFRPPTGVIVRSAIDPSIDLYYAAANDGKLYAGPSGGNWQNVFAHPNGETISDVRIDPADPTTVYAAFGGTGTGRVYRLKRSSPAPASMTVSDITSDLPSGLTIGRVVGSASGGALAVDRLRPLTIYVGTNRGVYCGQTTDGGNTWHWTLYDNGMPDADVADLEVHPTTGVLRAATYGRAVYEVNTDDPLGSLLGIDGKVTLLRVHDLGTGYGPPTDYINVEVVVWLDSMPGRAFGFQLRNDAYKASRQGMLKLLRDAFKSNRQVHLDYVRTGFENGTILRVWIP
jgi:photosystem II stability/assembly factor-like uncharacterized protein